MRNGHLLAARVLGCTRFIFLGPAPHAPINAIRLWSPRHLFARAGRTRRLVRVPSTMLPDCLFSDRCVPLTIIQRPKEASRAISLRDHTRLIAPNVVAVTIERRKLQVGRHVQRCGKQFALRLDCKHRLADRRRRSRHGQEPVLCLCNHESSELRTSA